MASTAFTAPDFPDISIDEPSDSTFVTAPSTAEASNEPTRSFTLSVTKTSSVSTSKTEIPDKLEPFPASKLNCSFGRETFGGL